MANQVKAPNVVFGLAPAVSKAAAAWNIDEKDEVTVVFFNRNRIVERWKFGAEGPDDCSCETASDPRAEVAATAPTMTLTARTSEIVNAFGTCASLIGAVQRFLP